MDVTFKLQQNTYRPYKKPNDNLTYINTSSNHPTQIVKHFTETISERLSRNSSSAKIFEQSKPHYEEALKKCDYKAILQYIQPNFRQNNTRKRTREIIWFNTPFSLNVKTNVAKMFLQLIDTHFPPTNKFHQIFNRSTVKVNHSCNQNISQIIKGHNKKVTKIKRHNQLDCNCRTKTECPLNGDCRKEDQIFKCTALTIFQKSASWSCRG